MVILRNNDLVFPVSLYPVVSFLGKKYEAYPRYIYWLTCPGFFGTNLMHRQRPITFNPN